MATTIQSVAGSINERGVLNGYYRKGFTQSKCISELIANSLDSMDKMNGWNNQLNKKIGFDVHNKIIRMIDNGYGMDRRSATNMFDMHRENHEKDTSRGVSGIGAKPALSILSEKKKVQVLTRVPDGAYLCITVPWDLMYSEGRYSGMITVDYMTDVEKAEFDKERCENQMTSLSGIHGTTIKFPFNSKLVQAIENNFPAVNEENEDCNPLDKIGVIFGRDNFECFYKHYEKIEKISILPKYNYLDGIDDNFYNGKSEDIIELWKKPEGECRFLWRDSEEKTYEIRIVGRGFGKIPERCTVSTTGYTKVAEFKVKVGLRKNSSFFDHNNPIMPEGSSSDKNINPYHTEHLGKDVINFLSCFKLVRNNQLIGTIPPPDTKISSHRANVAAFTEIVMTQCEVSYNPVSTQDCPEDHVMNIQENKNQYDGSSVDKRFTRLVASIKKKKFTEIWNYIQRRVEEYATPPDADTVEPSNITPSNSTPDNSVTQDLIPDNSSSENSATEGSAAEENVSQPQSEYAALLKDFKATYSFKNEPNLDSVRTWVMKWHWGKFRRMPSESDYKIHSSSLFMVHTEAFTGSCPATDFEEIKAPQPESPQPEAPQPEAPQPVIIEPEPPQAEIADIVVSNKTPSDVRPHRRGLVYSDEIIQQLERISLLIGQKEEYTDSETICLYNTLMYYNP